MNAVNVGLVTFIIQHNRIQGVFLLCKITNLLIYSKKNKPIIKKKWKSKLFQNELKQSEEIVKGLDPELSDEKYILNMTDYIIVDEIKNITKQLVQKGRL